MTDPGPLIPIRRTIVVDGLRTSYLDVGEGDPVVLLHGGEFGASAELGWERVLVPLAASGRRVVAPDLLGYGHTAKVVDFNDARGMRIRHVAALCAALGIRSADFVGNSMGAVMLLHDLAADPSCPPVMPVRRAALVCGGGTILDNEHVAALYDYDGSVEAMRRLVAALFHAPGYPADDEYVARRHASSLLPGAWEAVASARFRRPGSVPAARRPGPQPERIAVPTLAVEGGADKLLPVGWAAELAGRIPSGRAGTVPDAGHCPQVEQPQAVVDLLTEFWATT